MNPTLYELLATLVRHQNVLSPKKLIGLARRDPSGLSAERIEYDVPRLRVKLGWDRLGNDGSLLETAQGQGYRWRSVA